MASPGMNVGSYGSSYGGSSYGARSAGVGGAGGQQTVETNIRRCWDFDSSQHQTKCPAAASSFFEERLKSLAQSREPSPSDGTVRQATIERLQALLPTVFRPPARLQLVPYGSFLSSCYSRGSDLDLALCGAVDLAGLPAGGERAALKRMAGLSTVVPLEELEEADWVVLLATLADALEALGVARGQVTRVLDARVPIIKFRESASGVECDVCVTTRGCDFKGSVMRLCHQVQPSLAPLIRLVKLWAKQHDINNAHCGTLNSWSLALMALFSLQTYPQPPGALLPPLWRLFWDEEPSGAGGKGRPLQDKSTSLDVLLAVATQRCAEDATPLVDPAARREPPGLLQQLLWFMSCFSTVMGLWRDNAGHRNWRVSPWYGRGYVSRFPRAYVAAVEEPFDCNDNTARSLGIRERNEATLPYIAWVFGHSVHLLRNVANVKDAARTLVWLFGPEALPLVGQDHLQLPKNLLAPALLQRLQRACSSSSRRGSNGVGAGGSEQGVGASGDSDSGDSDGGGGHGGGAMTEEELHAAEQLALESAQAMRLIVDNTRVGSPIMCLEEWRAFMANSRQRPPHTWHRAPPPLPPHRAPGPHPLPANGHNHQQAGTPPPPPPRGARLLGPHTPPHASPLQQHLLQQQQQQPALGFGYDMQQLQAAAAGRTDANGSFLSSASALAAALQTGGPGASPGPFPFHQPLGGGGAPSGGVQGLLRAMLTGQPQQPQPEPLLPASGLGAGQVGGLQAAFQRAAAEAAAGGMGAGAPGLGGMGSGPEAGAGWWGAAAQAQGAGQAGQRVDGAAAGSALLEALRAGGRAGLHGGAGGQQQVGGQQSRASLDLPAAPAMDSMAAAAAASRPPDYSGFSRPWQLFQEQQQQPQQQQQAYAPFGQQQQQQPGALRGPGVALGGREAGQLASGEHAQELSDVLRLLSIGGAQSQPQATQHANVPVGGQAQNRAIGGGGLLGFGQQQQQQQQQVGQAVGAGPSTLNPWGQGPAAPDNTYQSALFGGGLGGLFQPQVANGTTAGSNALMFSAANGAHADVKAQQQQQQQQQQRPGPPGFGLGNQGGEGSGYQPTYSNGFTSYNGNGANYQPFAMDRVSSTDSWRSVASAPLQQQQQQQGSGLGNGTAGGSGALASLHVQLSAPVDAAAGQPGAQGLYAGKAAYLGR